MSKILKFFNRLWCAYLECIWNWLPANIQALKYRKQKKEALEFLERLKKLAPNYSAISRLLVDERFQWDQDPLGGLLDFHQKPWVTCARKAGDCEDFAYLWAEILVDLDKTEKLVSVSKKLKGHMMCIHLTGDMCYLLSNLREIKHVHTELKTTLETEFYREDTLYSFTF